MKINRIQRKAAFAAAILASAAAGKPRLCQAGSDPRENPSYGCGSAGRDSGDLKASKQSLEELLKIAPNDEGVQRMLADVNKDIERQAKGEAPVLAGVAKVAEKADDDGAVEKVEAAKTPVPEASKGCTRRSRKSSRRRGRRGAGQGRAGGRRHGGRRPQTAASSYSRIRFD